MSILLIHTGGTIAMAQSDQGFVPVVGIVEDAVAGLVAEGQVGAPVEILRLDPLIDSAQATPQDWLRVARTIHEAREMHDAFVVTHGTDTLAYTAAALCLALAGLDRPVIVTGAMSPLTVPGNDGLRNLTDAMAAAQTAPPGVWVQFGGRLLHGGRVRKVHSQAFDAFAATEGETAPIQPADAAALIEVAPHKVAILTATPDLCMDLFAHAVDCCDGLVLRCFGAGTVPDTAALEAVLTTARTREVPVVAVTQCHEGGTRLGTYAADSILGRTGVVDGRDMTAEAAFAKMQFALSRSGDFDARRRFLSSAQCGEMRR
ncbi:MAG: asparaginase [Celeribacter sp.]|jgi:L-asparaginase